MSGRIKFVDENGNPLQEEDSPQLSYTYETPSEYDQQCGTYNLSSYQLPHTECPSTFVCGVTSDSNTEIQQFAQCIDSMNCAMMVGMTTRMSSKSAIALFNHQVSWATLYDSCSVS